MQGGMKELQAKLQAEITELKKQLEERTGQLDQASTTIIARNDEITELKEKLAECQEFIEKLNGRLREMQE
jgi:peptidoglycan hydrolase CwlO-like protein